MQFLHPSVLWAFGLVLIPVIVHLFNFRRVKKVYFSNTFFLDSIARKTNTKSRLRKLLVLASRCLFIVFLVLAFAQPVKTEEGVMHINHTGIYLDNSLSMSAYDESGVSYLDKGISILNKYLRINDEGHTYDLLTDDYSDADNDLNAKRLEEELSEIGYSHRYRSLDQVYSRIGYSMNDPEEIFLISDFQNIGQALPEEIFSDTTTRISLINFSDGDPENLFVDSVYLGFSGGFSKAGQLNVVLRNEGVTRRKNVLVKVYKAGQQLSSFTMDIPPGAGQTKEVDLGEEKIDGPYRIEIEDNSRTFDNTFFFCIPSAKKIKVAVLYEGNGNKFVSEVFSNKELFDLSVQQLRNVSYQHLKDTDLLILSRLASIPDWLSSQLNLEESSILVIPGQKVDLDSYSALLGFRVAYKQDSLRETISAKSINIPLFRAAFEDFSDKISLPEVILSYEVGGYHAPVIQTNLDNGFLVRSGTRPVYFFTTPLSDDYTNFQKHALFVPVMYSLARDHQPDRQKLAFTFDDQLVTLQSDSLLYDGALELKNESGVFVPGVIRQNEKVQLKIPEELEEPGIWYLTREKDTLQALALNYSKRESLIDPDVGKRLNQLISGSDHISVFEFENAEEFDDAMRERKEGEGLWKYALLLALIFLMTEMLLLRFIK